MTTLIHHFLEHSARRFPEKTALITEESRYTYAQINSAANGIAKAALELTAKQGKRALLLMDNGFEYIACYYGALKSGACIVPLSTDLRPDGLNKIISEINPFIIMTTSKFERLLKAADSTLLKNRVIIINKTNMEWAHKEVSFIYWDQIADHGRVSENPTISIGDNQLASIIYTSGSSGTPKGVMLTHGNIVQNTRSICHCLDIETSDIQMVVLPFFYVMGKSLLNTNFSVGATIVVNNKIAYPASVLNQMVSERITSFSGVPSTYAHLLYRSPLAKFKEKLHHLRYCSQAGGHMPRSNKEKLLSILPKKTQLFIMYGATEAAARLTCMNLKEHMEKIESIGIPIPGVEITIGKIPGEKGAAVQKGELIAKGPNIMKGYWNDPEATSSAIGDEGYHTGDIGYKDEDGYLYVSGRKDRIIKVSGHRINLQEIEDVLLQYEDVTEAVVLAVKDEMEGHRLCALLAARGENNLNASLKRYCSAKLPRFKVPSTIRFVSSLPKYTNGKTNTSKCLDLVLSENNTARIAQA